MTKVRGDIEDPKYVASQLEDKAKVFLGRGKWKEAETAMNVALRNAKKTDSLAYVKEVTDNLSEIKRGRNPYVSGAYRSTSYLLIFVSFILGALLLSGNITGNIVGSLKQNTSNIFGFVLVGLGIVGYMVLVSRRFK